ncbi:hypothetical protein EDD18DRAFT_542379 [Armillaria luteobubalina]|uniref:Uncharacterized protein n=1 Tax=Armillaria luteobubalina TaxID=153913 RepID=A0AA39UJF2_9AGAR|nr:hypothetical protein EDD18DRAFT_542379 [Armillaria luteobubalina]
MATTNTNAPICRFYQRGSCKFGSRCKNQHLNIISETNNNRPQDLNKKRIRTRGEGGRSGTANAPSSGAAPHWVTYDPVCFSWQKGSCARGDTCRFSHPAKGQDDPLDGENQELEGSSSSSNVLYPKGEGYQPVPDAYSGPYWGDLLMIAKAEDHAESEQLRQEEVQRKREEQHSLEEILIYWEEQPQIDEKPLTSDVHGPQTRQHIVVGTFDSGSEDGPSWRPREDDVDLAESEAKQAWEENERLYQEEVEGVQRKRDGRYGQEEACIRQQEHQRRIDEEQRAADAHRTHQCTVFGSIVTFSPGLAIQNIIAGFDCCRIRVKNIPHDGRPHEIEDLFLQQGLDVSDFHVVAVDSTSNGTKQADIITNATVAQILAVGLEGIEFRDERLEFEVGTYNLPGGMGALPPEDENVLTISCRAPSATYTVAYPDMTTCLFKVVELDGCICSGRKVMVEIQSFAGRLVPTFRRNAITISNLPNDASLAMVCDFAKSDYSHVQLLTSSNFDIDAACHQLQLQINKVAGGEVRSFDVTSRGDTEDGIFSVRVRFKTWECAKKVEDTLANRCYPFIGNSMFWLKLSQQQLYTIIIPSQQYSAQAILWTDLWVSIKDPKACDLFIREGPGEDFRVQISGADKAAVGALKVRIENLASGEKFDQWHELLALSSVARKIKYAGAFMRPDFRTRSIKLYGASIAITRAKAILKEEIDRLMSMQSSVQLERRSVGYFLHTGLGAMKEVFGEDSVALDIRSAKITIRGGEEISLHLKNHIAESLKAVIVPIAPGNHTCPVCYDEASAPFQLICQHVYCTVCIRHFLTSAAETGIFPLACIGNGATCGTLISIPVIQKFLPQNSFDHLLETVFTSYIDKQPQVFGYCKTPDCTQIYRKSESPSPLLCPSCFSRICSSCGDDLHIGMECQCERARISNNMAEQERLSEAWITQQSGIRKCPVCSRLLEKAAGCNHMECPCGSHICWCCMGVFPRDDIYRHMNAEHGGYYVADPNPDANLNNNAPDPFQGADYREQARLLRELEVRRQRRCELPVRPQERGSFCVVM